MRTVTIEDKTGNHGTVTVSADDVAATLHPWFNGFPREVIAAVDELQKKIDRNDDLFGLPEYLGIHIS